MACLYNPQKIGSVKKKTSRPSGKSSKPIGKRSLQVDRSKRTWPPYRRSRESQCQWMRLSSREDLRANSMSSPLKLESPTWRWVYLFLPGPLQHGFGFSFSLPFGTLPKNVHPQKTRHLCLLVGAIGREWPSPGWERTGRGFLNKANQMGRHGLGLFSLLNHLMNCGEL